VAKGTTPEGIHLPPFVEFPYQTLVRPRVGLRGDGALGSHSIIFNSGHRLLSTTAAGCNLTFIGADYLRIREAKKSSDSWLLVEQVLANVSYDLPKLERLFFDELRPLEGSGAQLLKLH
jgi:hypothetical protein